MKSRGSIGFFLVLVVVALSVSVGCSPFSAMKQPDKKDLNVLSPGTSRDLVLAELGAPVVSGKDYDIFAFVQGYSKGIKAVRSITHGILDVVTLGLWELIATPIEGAATGEKVRLKIIYDAEQRIVRVEKLFLPPEKEEK